MLGSDDPPTPSTISPALFMMTLTLPTRKPSALGVSKAVYHKDPTPNGQSSGPDSSSPAQLHPMVTRLRDAIHRPLVRTDGTVRYPLPRALAAQLSSSSDEPTCFSQACLSGVLLWLMSLMLSNKIRLGPHKYVMLSAPYWILGNHRLPSLGRPFRRESPVLFEFGCLSFMKLQA